MKKSAVILVAFFMLISISACVRENHSQPGVKKVVWSVPEEYLEMFTSQTRKQLKNLTTFEMKSGLASSGLSYIYQTHGHTNGYFMEIFKVELKGNEPLGQIIAIKPDTLTRDADTSFTRLLSGEVYLKYKDGSAEQVSKVVFSFNGDSFKLNRRQDNLLYYDIGFKKFSIAYDNGSEFRAWGSQMYFTHDHGKLIFLKKDNALYTIFISDNGIEPFSKKDTVLSLFKKDLISNQIER